MGIESWGIAAAMGANLIHCGSCFVVVAVYYLVINDPTGRLRLVGRRPRRQQTNRRATFSSSSSASYRPETEACALQTLSDLIHTR